MIPTDINPAPGTVTITVMAERQGFTASLRAEDVPRLLAEFEAAGPRDWKVKRRDKRAHARVRQTIAELLAGSALDDRTGFFACVAALWDFVHHWRTPGGPAIAATMAEHGRAWVSVAIGHGAWAGTVAGGFVDLSPALPAAGRVDREFTLMSGDAASAAAPIAGRC